MQHSSIAYFALQPDPFAPIVQVIIGILIIVAFFWFAISIAMYPPKAEKNPHEEEDAHLERFADMMCKSAEARKLYREYDRRRAALGYTKKGRDRIEHSRDLR